MHFDGTGILKDEARAVELFQKACDAQVGVACHNLGLAFTQGRGAPKDPSRAAGFHERGCKADFEASCRWLKLQKP